VGTYPRPTREVLHQFYLLTWSTRDSFSHDLILIPAWNSHPAKWTNPDGCLWDAPSSFASAVPLKEAYSSSFQSSSTELQHMEQFFCETLAVNNLEWTDVINELKALKQQPAGIRSEVIEELYSILSSMSSILDSDKEIIRWVVCA
jgi:hypothetical protein